MPWTAAEFDPCPLDTPRYINMHISQYVRLPHILWIIMSVHCTLMVRSFSTFLHKFYSSLIFKNHLFIYSAFSYFILMFLDFCSGCFLFYFTFYRYTQNTKANSFIIIVKNRLRCIKPGIECNNSFTTRKNLIRIE